MHANLEEYFEQNLIYFKYQQVRLRKLTSDGWRHESDSLPDMATHRKFVTNFVSILRTSLSSGMIVRTIAQNGGISAQESATALPLSGEWFSLRTE